MKALSLIDLSDNPYLGDFLGVDLRHLSNVTSINLARTALRGDCLGWLPDCDHLSLNESHADDDTLSSLPRCARLHNLEVSDTDVNGRGLGSLSPLPRLEVLALDRCPLSDESLRFVSSLGCVRVLSVRGTPVTDRGLKWLCRTPRLEFVDVGECSGITLAEVSRLRKALTSARAVGDPDPEVRSDLP